ncbi:MAG: HD domain-containing phosphohydrolase [Atribacterota bacterium]
MFWPKRIGELNRGTGVVQKLSLNLIDMVKGISECVDLVNPAFSKHHAKVAYIALNIAQSMNLPLDEKRDLVIASLLHDVGALSTEERLQYLAFEADFEFNNPHGHAATGHHLFKQFEPFFGPALLIKHHHTYYRDMERNTVPSGACILQLADRVAVLAKSGDEIPVREIESKVYAQRTRMFHPDVVDVFLDISQSAHFWPGMERVPLDVLVEENGLDTTVDMDLEELRSFASILHVIIDFRSRFTAWHSCGVAGVAVELARHFGFSEESLKLMEIAGNLHDLGKVAIPIEILEKPDTLTEEEFTLVKSHAYYTYRVLQQIKDLETITIWGSFHHEKLDGSGYPFSLKGEDLPLGSRIMAVSDIFSALTEDRPYRSGLSVSDALGYIKGLVGDDKIDKNVFSVLEAESDYIVEKLSSIKEESIKRFDAFYSDVEV